jgi:putative membrane-bound dehydrogenase-like protein
MPPEEAAATIRLPEGFRANVFAAEPDVRNPIAMAWDDRGRLWIAENYTYAERTVRLAGRFRDRILIFRDENRDGRAEAPSVFAEDLVGLTGIEVAPEGVYAMCPPNLLFLRDRDRDDAPDGPAEVILDGFTVPDANHHNFANGLRFGPDGWLYGRCGASAPGEVGAPGTAAAERVPLRGTIWRWHPSTRVFEALASGTTNPWGHDWNEDGDLFFVNTVNGHFWRLIPGAHYTRPHTLDPNPRVYEAIDFHADHWHFDTRGDWTKSRDGAANEFGGGHAHSGLMIYRGTRWPESYRGKAFTLNFHGRRINVERLDRHGAGHVARHEADFAVWEDPFFRGIELSEGPDGAVYVLDWSDTGECHENTGVHRTSGRIYRIDYGDGQPPFPWNPDWRRRPDPDPESLVARSQHWPLDTVLGRRPPGRAEASAEEIDRALAGPSTPLERASVLQRLPVERRLEAAAPLVAEASFRDDHDLPWMVWYGLIPVADSDPAGLARLAGTTTWVPLQRLVARRLAEDTEANPGPLGMLLELATAGGPEFRAAVVGGMNQATAGWRRAAAPPGWAAFAARASREEGSTVGVRDLEVLFGDGRALAELQALALDGNAALPDRKAALRTLLDGDPEEVAEICRKLVQVRFLNAEAAQGLARVDHDEAARALIGAWKQFHPQDRDHFFAAATSRPRFAGHLLEAMARGEIPKEALGAFHARQILLLGDARLKARLEEVWGSVGEGSGQGQAVAEWRGKLSPEVLATGDKGAGRVLFQGLCGACHRLYGEGGSIGPDLTGSGRNDLDYLLENILDPGAVVSAEYRLSALTLADGRSVAGVIRSRTERTWTVQTMTGEVSVPAGDVRGVEKVEASLMPAGLAQALSEAQFRDLIAYLMHPVQVPLPSP